MTMTLTDRTYFCEPHWYITPLVCIYGLINMHFPIFCQFLKIQNWRTWRHHDVIRGCGSVDHEIVDLVRNWEAALVLRVRGGGGEHRGPAEQTIWSPELCRRPWLRRRTVAHGGGVVQRGKEREEKVRRCASSPRARGRGRRRRGRADGGVMMLEWRRSAREENAWFRRSSASRPAAPGPAEGEGRGGARGGAG